VTTAGVRGVQDHDAHLAAVREIQRQNPDRAFDVQDIRRLAGIEAMYPDSIGKRSNARRARDMDRQHGSRGDTRPGEVKQLTERGNELAAADSLLSPHDGHPKKDRLPHRRATRTFGWAEVKLYRPSGSMMSRLGEGMNASRKNSPRNARLFVDRDCNGPPLPGRLLKQGGPCSHARLISKSVRL
jgi:hypothetical protein